MGKQKRNILFLFTDMQRADTISALGNPHINTPHLDKLVKQGTAYTNCFSPSPVCVPARCCMHYGLYPQKTGLYTNGKMMPDNGMSIPAVLGTHGYRTHAVGKCHFTPNSHARRGFQSRVMQEECTSDPKKDDYVAWLKKYKYDFYEPHGARGDMYYIPQISSLPTEAHPTQWVGNECIQFIKETNRKNRGKPWFLFGNFIHPHPPFAPPKPWHKLYRAPEMPLPFVPRGYEELYTWINRKQNRYKFRDHGIDQNLIRLIIAYYYATISFVDFQIGRIIATLEKAGQLDKTLILFASDHGEHLGDLNCFGKRSMHNASARVPMLVRFPSRFKANHQCSTAVSLVDIFPTILAAADIPATDIDLDGIDLASVSRGECTRETVFSQFSQKETGIYMAVNERWKYVYSAGDNREFFFNRKKDPSEARNIADTVSWMNQKEKLKKELLTFLSNNGVTGSFTRRGAELGWKKYRKIDQGFLKNPDEGLLFQDYPP